MPDRRTSSVTSFFSGLHFSGKVIMASVLFGFGLLLVGAILLIFATGTQSSPPLKNEGSGSEEKSPMTFVGPGVMGVGAFFVIVGTIMCLFETRILRLRRKNTERDTLVNAEVIPTGNTVSSSSDHRDNIDEEGDVHQVKIEETEVKTVHADHHFKSSTEKVEKPPIESNSLEKDSDKELSTSGEREQVSTFNTSVYVDAVEETENDNDNEDMFATESTQFSTPPENKPEVVLKASFDGRSDTGYDRSESPDHTLTGTAKTTESTKDILSAPKETESHLPAPKETESHLPMPKEIESNLPVPKETESHLPVPKETESHLPMPKEIESNLPVPKETESHLPVPKETESHLPVPKETESHLPVPKETESHLPVSDVSTSSEILKQSSVPKADLTKETPHSFDSPNSPVKEASNE